MLKKPKFKIGKRLGAGVYDKCQTPKFSTSPRGFRGKRRRQLSEYGAQLIEKQKIRFSYGITERQLSNYVKKANRAKTSIADKLYDLLESRLDNVVYRMGLTPSRRAARQMVSHGHVVINGKKMKIPSHLVSSGDLLQIREGSKGKKIFEGLEVKLKDYNSPAWLSFDPAKMEGKIIDKPINDETFLDLNAVLEFYSR